MKILLVVLLSCSFFNVFAQADEAVDYKTNELVIHPITGDGFHIGKTPFYFSEIRYSRYFSPNINGRLAVSYRNYTGKNDDGYENDALSEYGVKCGFAYDLAPRAVQFYVGGDLFFILAHREYDTNSIAGAYHADIDYLSAGINVFGGIKKVVAKRVVIGFESSLEFGANKRTSNDLNIPKRNRTSRTIDFRFNVLSNFYVGYVF